MFVEIMVRICRGSHKEERLIIAVEVVLLKLSSKSEALVLKLAKVYCIIQVYSSVWFQKKDLNLVVSFHW